MKKTQEGEIPVKLEYRIRRFLDENFDRIARAIADGIPQTVDPTLL